MLKVIKRDCSEQDFSVDKIEIAILKAMKYGSGIVDENIAKNISLALKAIYCSCKDKEEVSIYEIEDDVFKALCDIGHVDTARAYEGFRAVREFQRENPNTTDDSILGLIDLVNEEVMNENSNKNAMMASTQRDLIAGEVSKDISRRKKLPARIVQAHDEGVLHFHK